MNRETKYTAIPKSVKEAVWERDRRRCVICGDFNAQPNAHYIRRSKGGMGIEENIVSLCRNCHNAMDERIVHAYADIVKEYLQSKYPDWDESKLIYRKDHDR